MQSFLTLIEWKIFFAQSLFYHDVSGGDNLVVYLKSSIDYEWKTLFLIGRNAIAVEKTASHLIKPGSHLSLTVGDVLFVSIHEENFSTKHFIQRSPTVTIADDCGNVWLNFQTENMEVARADNSKHCLLFCPSPHFYHQIRSDEHRQPHLIFIITKLIDGSLTRFEQLWLKDLHIWSYMFLMR